MQPRKVGRRGYVKYAGIAAIGVAGSAFVVSEIGRKDQSNDQTVTPLKPEYTTKTPSSTTVSKINVKNTSTSIENGKSLVSIIEGNSDADIEGIVRKSVDAIGGMREIVSQGEKVVIKPPVLASDKDCAPDPRVVAAVVKLVREAGGVVTVAESSGSGSTIYNLSKVGITSAVEDEGAEVMDLQTEKEVQIMVPVGVALHEVKIYPTIYDCDVLISVPRLKRHSSATVTISLKNMMGTLPRYEMRRFHRTNLSQCIADLNTVIKPDLTVVDATFPMTRTGPTGGDTVRFDTVIASRDPVSVDLISAQKLQELEERIELPAHIRFEATDVKHIYAAADLGVGTCNLDNIQIIEEGFY